MKRVLYDLLSFIKSLYPNENPIPLHAPRFQEKEKKYLADCIDSTYVSYVGPYVTKFEDSIRAYTGARHAIAMVNGTAAIQIALIAAGLQPGEEVITQALTFVATANGIKHADGEPVFIDVDKDTLGMSPVALSEFLSRNIEKRNDGCYNTKTGRKIFAVMPMHTFGLACRIKQIKAICEEWGLLLMEDAAESLGTFVEGIHTGNFGIASVLSFNGNKPVTTGGGGMILTNNDAIAEKARHISTTAKLKHQWEFFHDELGWNYRMPNVNAAIGFAQMERIDAIIKNKQETAQLYAEWGKKNGVQFIHEMPDTHSNYWLNAMVVTNRDEREEFLAYSNANGVQTRPIWVLMNKLPMYKNNFSGPLENSLWLEDRIVNVPSSVRICSDTPRTP